MQNSVSKPIIVFDMDGTLINHENIVHPQDIELLASPNPPAIFVPATGRSLFTLRRIMQETGLLNGNPIPFPFICQNGAFVYDLGEKCIHSALFELPVQEQLLAICKSMTDTCFLIFDQNDMRIVHPTAFALDETEKYLLDHKEFDENEPFIMFSKIMCLSDDPRVFKEFISRMEGIDVEIAASTRTILEVNPAGVNKALGIEVLAKHKLWNMGDILCAGDGENDIHMLEKFENSFSPITSPQHIRERAANTIDTSKEGLLTPILNFAQSRKQ
jgi:hypothetical protein